MPWLFNLTNNFWKKCHIRKHFMVIFLRLWNKIITFSKTFSMNFDMRTCMRMIVSIFKKNFPYVHLQIVDSFNVYSPRSKMGVSEEKEKNGSTKQLRTETKIKSQWKYKITQNKVQNWAQHRRLGNSKIEI